MYCREMTEERGLAGGVDCEEADTGMVMVWYVWYGGLTPKAGNGAWSLDAVWSLRLLALTLLVLCFSKCLLSPA